MSVKITFSAQYSELWPSYVSYHDDDGAVLVEERLVARQRGDDGEPLLREEVALVLVQARPVRAPVLQPAHTTTWMATPPVRIQKSAQATSKIGPSYFLRFFIITVRETPEQRDKNKDVTNNY
jgi:hypothetical protein